MKKALYYFLFIFILFLLQVSGVKVFSHAVYAIPQLMLLFVIIFALSNSFTSTLWVSFGAGFLLEWFSGAYFGSQIFAMVASALLAYFLTRNITARDISIPTAVFLVLLTTLLYGFWIYIYNLTADGLNLAQSIPFRSVFSWNLLWTCIVNLIFFWPISFFYRLLPE